MSNVVLMNEFLRKQQINLVSCKDSISYLALLERERYCWKPFSSISGQVNDHDH